MNEKNERQAAKPQDMEHFDESQHPNKAFEDFGLTKEQNHLLIDNYAYIWKKDDSGNLLIRSSKGDPTNPRSWPNWKRYGIVGLASLLNNLVSCHGEHPFTPNTDHFCSRFVSACLATVLVLSRWRKRWDLVLKSVLLV